MTASAWNWKGKDGARGGLLYEPGNWGDLLKALWLTAALEWKIARVGPNAVRYFDPFAGGVEYPLGVKTLSRFNRAAPDRLACIRKPFVERGAWPSSASVAALFAVGGMELYDADAGRIGAWRGRDGVTVLEGGSGWSLLAGRAPDSEGLWLLDPYDFVAEWREALPLVAEKAAGSTVLLYVYNRSARSAEAFREYRAFRCALEDARGGLPVWMGRVGADAFLPTAHHEMFLLPGAVDSEAPGLGALTDRLGADTMALVAAQARAAAFDG